VGLSGGKYRFVALVVWRGSDAYYIVLDLHDIFSYTIDRLFFPHFFIPGFCNAYFVHGFFFGTPVF
jgi:hypothetical protein